MTSFAALRQSAQRVFFLTQILSAGAGKNLLFVLLLWLSGMLLLTLGVSWDEVCKAAVLLGLPLEGFGGGRPREGTLCLLLSEFLSWAWLLVALGFVLPAVLLPLAHSYSMSSTLWVRLTPCTPRELALARMFRPLAAAGLLALLGATWAVLCAFTHGLPASGLLMEACGLPAHVLVSAGIVTLFGTRCRFDLGRVLLAVTSFFAPIFSFLLYATLVLRAPWTGKIWWPYTTPFASALVPAEYHYVSAIALGGMLFFAAWLLCRGKLVLLSPSGSGGPL